MKPLFSFSVLSDLHFMAYKDTGEPVDWVPFLNREVLHIAKLQPDFIVVNGDLTNGKERDYRLALSVLRRCGMPIYYTMGNHEYYGYYEDEGFTPELAQQRFLTLTGSPGIYYDKTVHGFPLLFLSTEDYTPDSRDAAWLSNRQLGWLEERLRLAASAGKPALLFLHQPVNGTVADSDNTCMQSDALRSILRRFPGNMLFSGHTHCRMDREDQIVRQDGTVFVGGGCMYEAIPQSRWVDVFADRIVLRLLCHRTRTWLDGYETTIRFAAGSAFVGNA